MKKTELKALIKEAFLTEQKNTLLNESAPGFDNRKQGEPLPTLESIKAAYQAKKLEETAEETKEETEAKEQKRTDAKWKIAGDYCSVDALKISTDDSCFRNLRRSWRDGLMHPIEDSS